jgi:putative transposase
MPTAEHIFSRWSLIAANAFYVMNLAAAGCVKPSFTLANITDAWVLLPDHLHCVWTLPENDNDFSTRWNIIKKRFTQAAKTTLHQAEFMNKSKHKHRESTIWQRRFWEHQIRDDEDYRYHIQYTHYNPVKHGLVNNPYDWQYSTIHRYPSH